MKKSSVVSITLLMSALLFFAINMFSQAFFQGQRADLTEHHLYTLSDGTKNLLREIKEPLILRFYYSKSLAQNLPAIQRHANRIKALLKQYQQAANGRIIVKLIDPEPFSPEEDEAVGYGLQAVPINSQDTYFYFGLVGTDATDRKQVIAFFQSEREAFLEYDISQIVYQLIQAKTKTVGIISPLPLQGDAAFALLGRGSREPWMAYQQLEQLFTVNNLDKNLESIPDNIDVLMLAHTQFLNTSTAYAIDQFVQNGGHVLAWVDPYSEAGSNKQPDDVDENTVPMNQLLTAWGVKLDTQHIVTDRSSAKKIRYHRDGRQAVIDYPLWMDIPAKQMNSDDIVVANLEHLVLASPGALSILPESSAKITPLFTSSKDAMLTTLEQARLAIDSPELLLKDYKADKDAPYTFAVRIEGYVKSAFPNGAPFAEAKSEPNNATQSSEALTKKTPPTHIIVVADSDLLFDNFWVQVSEMMGERVAVPTAGNGAFLINAIDNLSGSNDLISVRNRGNSQRPLTTLKALKLKAEQSFREKAQALMQELSTAQVKLKALSEHSTQSKFLLSPEEQAQVEDSRQQIISTRQQLREVQLHLNKDIKRLEYRIIFLNSAILPLLLVGLCLILSRRYLHKPYRIRN